MRGSILGGGSLIGVSVGAMFLGSSFEEGSWRGRGALGVLFGWGGVEEVEEGRGRKGGRKGLGGGDGCFEDSANGTCTHRVGEVYGMEVSRRDRRVESSDV